MHEFMRRIPQGTNDRGSLRLTPRELLDLVEQGVPWLVERGQATEEDLEHIEQGGAIPGASADAVSKRAVERGHTQVGSLGAGNHFLELQAVDEIFDEDVAAAWGVERGQAAVMIHSGSRGFGHQTCTDHLQRMAGAVRQYGYELPDRQLACAPVDSPEGADYLAAMAAAANFAFANRQVMTTQVRGAFEQVFRKPWERLGVFLLYDVAHNIAKLEEHEVDGRTMKVWVHRKGATRAFGPGHPELGPAFVETGQPVIVPGSMGTESWLMVGTATAMSRELRLRLPRRRPAAQSRRRQAAAQRRRGARGPGGQRHHRPRAEHRPAGRRGALRLQGRLRGRRRGARGRPGPQGGAPQADRRAQRLGGRRAARPAVSARRGATGVLGGAASSHAAVRHLDLKHVAEDVQQDALEFVHLGLVEGVDSGKARACLRPRRARRRSAPCLPAARS